MRHWWWLLVRFIHRTFEYGVVTEEVAWEMVFFFSKGKRGYQGV